MSAIKGKKDWLSKAGLEATDIQTESSLTLTAELHIFQRTAQPCSVTADRRKHDYWGIAECLKCQGTGCVHTWARMEAETQAISAETRRTPSSMIHSLKGNSSPSCIHWMGCVLATRQACLSLKGSLRFARAAWHTSHISHRAVTARLLHQPCHSPC